MSHNWIRQHPGVTPPLRKGHVVAYDSTTGMIILFGGASGTRGHLNDSWAWDGNTWKLLHPPLLPPARVDASMVGIGSTDQVLLFGGVKDSGDLLADTWLWNGKNWIQQHPLVSPSIRSAASIAYHVASKMVILFGGQAANGRASIVLNDTWLWNGSTWVEQQPATLPPPRAGACIAYTNLRSVVEL